MIGRRDILRGTGAALLSFCGDDLFAEEEPPLRVLSKKEERSQNGPDEESFQHLVSLGQGAPLPFSVFYKTMNTYVDSLEGIDFESNNHGPQREGNISIISTSQGELGSYGLAHTGEVLKSENEALKEFISQYDIICLESADFFEVLAEEALRQGKEIRCVDPHMSKIEVGADHEINVTVVANYINFLIGFYTKFNAHKGFHWKLNLASLLVGQYTVIPVTSLVSACVGLCLKSKYAGGLDIAYLTDGRTIEIYNNTEIVAQNNPGKSIGVISGENHHEGLRYYAKRPKLLARKNEFYQKTIPGFGRTPDALLEGESLAEGQILSVLNPIQSKRKQEEL